MIDIIDISKEFNGIQALNHVSMQVKKASIFGLVGTNGAGKSTLLRILAGILEQDCGHVTIEGKTPFENTVVKSSFFYISDDQYFFPNSTPKELRNYYDYIYPKFDKARFDHLLANFELSLDRKINTFSKGMKKQVSVIAAIASNVDYIFCDETFDGLDPVMRQGVKSLFAAALTEREMTAVIASHNLRELEDISDHIGLLHKGGILLSRDLDDIKTHIHKVQAIFPDQELTREQFADLDILRMEKRGSLYTIIARGDTDKIMKTLEREKPTFSEALPLSLEEIFINETEVKGYDVRKLLI